MLLEFPNPKDPQDAEVAKMLVEDPERFARTAHDWAVKYGGAPRKEVDLSQWAKGAGAGTPAAAVDDEARYVSCSNLRDAEEDDGWLTDCRYQGYSRELVNRFVTMGFDTDAVVEAFVFVGIDRNGGQDYEVDEAFMGDITARLLGES